MVLTVYFNKLKLWANQLKIDIAAIYIAGRDSRTPRMAKIIAIGTAAYTLSPIDLIPDVIPVLGYLDDLIIVPLGIWLVVRLIPVELMTEYRGAANTSHKPMANWAAAGCVIGVWLFSAMCLWRLVS